MTTLLEPLQYDDTQQVAYVQALRCGVKSAVNLEDLVIGCLFQVVIGDILRVQACDSQNSGREKCHLAN